MNDTEVLDAMRARLLEPIADLCGLCDGWGDKAGTDYYCPRCGGTGTERLGSGNE